MKNSKKLATLAVLFALVGCGGNGTSTSNKTSSSNAGNSTTSTPSNSSTPSISTGAEDLAYLKSVAQRLIYDGRGWTTDGIRGDITDLITSMEDGAVSISYASSNTDIIVIDGDKGIVTLPEAGSTTMGYEVVTLTATLTYKGQTTTKDFKVKVHEVMGVSKISDIHANTQADTYEIKGTVTGINSRGFTVYDGTGSILVYLNSLPTVAVGDYVKVSGTVTFYQSVAQYDSSASVTVLNETAPAEAVFDFTTPTAYDGAAITAWAQDGGKVGPYITVRGALSVSGYYYNLTIDGTTYKGSLSYPLESSNFSSFDGKVVDVTGFLLYVSGSDTKYANIMVTDLKEPELSETEKVDAVKNDLTVPAAATNSLSLPKTGEYGATITWESANTAVIAIDSEGNATVTQDEKNATVVKLTATISLGETTATKEFNVTVLPINLEATHTITNIKTTGTAVTGAIVEATVVGVNTRGYYLTDGTNTIEVYGSDSAVKEGDKVLVQLNVTPNEKYGLQGGNAILLQTISEGNESGLTPVNYAFADLYSASNSKQVIEQTYVNDMVGKYVEVTGYMLSNGTYYNFYKENSTDSSSINLMNTTDAKLEDVKANLGVEVTIRAYVYGFSQGASVTEKARYIQLVFDKVVAKETPNPDPVVDNLFVATDWEEADELQADVNEGAKIVYWADQNWSGSKVNATTSVEDGVFTIASTLESGSNWFALQAFINVPNNAADDTYDVSLTLNSSVAGKITFNGKTVELVVGENKLTDTVTVASATRWDGAGYITAPVSIQFGVNPDVDATVTAEDNAIMQTATYSLSNIVIAVADTTDDTPVTPAEAVLAASITFDTTANRTEISTEKQVWQANGITVTGEKASSTTDVADYSNPVRFYKSSKLTVAYSKEIVKIVITCKYANKCYSSSDTIPGATLTVEDKVMTIVLDTPATSFTIDSLATQLRVVSIDVYTAA